VEMAFAKEEKPVVPEKFDRCGGAVEKSSGITGVGSEEVGQVCRNGRGFLKVRLGAEKAGDGKCLVNPALSCGEMIGKIE